MAIAYAGPMRAVMARLCEVLGRLDDADDLYETSLDACRDLGALPAVARTLVEHGTLLARRGARRQARERIEEGRALAESLGMAAVVEQARSVPTAP